MQKATYKTNGHAPLPGGIAASIPESDNWWDDPEFQNGLVALLINDQHALQSCAPLLSADDFKPSKGVADGHARWLVAERALEYFEKHNAPLGSLVRADVLEYAQVNGLKDYLKRLNAIKAKAPDSLVEKVLRFKNLNAKKAAVNELADLLAAGQLTDEKWDEISQRVLTVSTNNSGETPEGVQWPEPMADAAFYGLAGEVVRAIEPHTESDPAALLVQFLLVFGNVIGRHAHWRVESTRHHLNLFAVLVGATSKARKGTSLDRVLDLFEDIDRDWLCARRMGGLSTGEGLISAVRDPVLNKEGKEVDAGEFDKRLLIVEPEFARVLKVGERDAATLPSILRDAWDKGDLRTLTKESPLRATGAHISVIGHITEDELRRTLSDNNRSNGFANRFLWVCVRRSKSLPLGGAALGTETRTKLVARIQNAVKKADSVRRLGLGSRAKPLWIEQYRQLSEGLTGALGATTDRAEAQVRRLACLYALLDCQQCVLEVHMRAALEVWRYCLDSARFLFGTTSGDPVADTILKALRQRGAAGMSRNEIRTDLFQQNKSSEAIGHALQSLRKRGLIRSRAIPSQGAGRPTEQWCAV